MEIEKKYLIKSLPQALDTFAYHLIEQGYLLYKSCRQSPAGRNDLITISHTKAAA